MNNPPTMLLEKQLKLALEVVLLRDAAQVVFSDLKKILEYQEYRCFLTGRKFSLEDPIVVDRYYASKDYTPDNIILIIMPIYKMRRDMPIEEFRSLCRYVTQGQGNPRHRSYDFPMKPYRPTKEILMVKSATTC